MLQKRKEQTKLQRKYKSDPLRLGVFISGSGRTLKNLIECSGPDFQVVSAVADRHCSGLRYAAEARLPIFVSEYHDTMWEAILRDNPDYICLAGFLSLLPVPNSHKGRVLNIHPALIPKFCGKGMYGNKVHKAVLESGDTESGCTVHFCDNEYDHGEIILQKKLTVDPSWNHPELAAAVFELEKIAYPEAIKSLNRGQQLD